MDRVNLLRNASRLFCASQPEIALRTVEPRQRYRQLVDNIWIVLGTPSIEIAIGTVCDRHVRQRGHSIVAGCVSCETDGERLQL